MTLTIGRCVLNDPSEISSSGDTLTFSGLYVSTAATAAARAAEVQMREMQLVGMVDNQDESVFPLTFSGEARFDGFYFVEAASMSYVNEGSGRASAASWSVTVRRLVDGPNALTEMTCLTLVRTNGHSLTTATNNELVAFSANWTDFELRFLPTSTVTRQSPSGGITVWLGNTSTVFTGSLGMTFTPSTFYDGTTMIEYQAADNNWYPVIGRDVPAAFAGRWRLSNGCLRLEPSTTVGTLKLSVYSGAAWESVEFLGNAFLSAAHRAMNLTANLTPTWLTPAIVRNGPDSVVLSSAGYATDGTSSQRYGITISLSRGTHHVELTIQNNSGNQGLRIASATASTALATATAGLRATSNDANGNRIVLMAADSTTRDLTNGRIYVAGASTAARAFAAGIELDGSSAAAGNTSADLLGQFIGVSNITTKVVKR